MTAKIIIVDCEAEGCMAGIVVEQQPWGVPCQHCNALGVIKSRFTKNTSIYATEQAANVAKAKGTAKPCPGCTPKVVDPISGLTVLADAGTGTAFESRTFCPACKGHGKIEKTVAEPLTVPAPSENVFALWNRMETITAGRWGKYGDDRALVPAGSIDDDGIDLL